MPITVNKGEKKMHLTIQVFKTEKDYVANCVEFDIYSFAATKEKAIWRMRKICSFYLDFAKNLGLSFEELTSVLTEKQIIEPAFSHIN